MPAPASPTTPTVIDVRFTAAGTTDGATGLLGFVSLTLADAVTIDGIKLRRTLRGELTLAFPKHTDSWGIVHAVVRPVDDAARRAITVAVLAALGMDAGAAETSPNRQGESAP